jgi:hypothetical protein
MKVDISPAKIPVVSDDISTEIAELTAVFASNREHRR